MKLNWFVRKGIFYRPVSLIGWLILLLGLAYAGYIFIDIDSRSHSASDTLINFGFNLLLTGLTYTVIAYLTERRPKAVSN